LEKEKQKKEHILVCLSSSPSNEKIIRTAAQMAQAFQAGFTALYVQTAEKQKKHRRIWQGCRSMFVWQSRAGQKL
jgi:two-component system sensor histidine kinase KdpD